MKRYFLALLLALAPQIAAAQFMMPPTLNYTPSGAGIARQGSAALGTLAFNATPSYSVNASSTLVTIAVANPNSGGSSGVTGITYGGSSMTVQTFHDATDNDWITLGYLLTPPTGSHTFVFSGLTAGSVIAYASDYSGVSGADGTFITNNGTVASLTTNVALASGNEWVVCASLAGHPTFISTTNMTVVQQGTFIQSALQDSNTGYGSGTVGFVTTLSGSAFRQWVVMQAFKP